MSKWEKARAALALNAQQTSPRTTAQIALAEALTELVPDEQARLYVVCNNLLDPEENRWQTGDLVHDPHPDGGGVLSLVDVVALVRKGWIGA